MSLLVFLMIVVPLAVWMVWPLFAVQSPRGALGPAGADDARRRRETLIGELRDLEMDREMGKMGDDDYRELRSSLESEAIALMAEQQGGSPPSAGEDGKDRPG